MIVRRWYSNFGIGNSVRYIMNRREEEEREAHRKRAIGEAIEKLGSIARYDGSFGGQEPLEMRLEAVRTLASYVPHPEAVKILTKIVDAGYLNKELRIAAMQALRHK